MKKTTHRLFKFWLSEEPEKPSHTAPSWYMRTLHHTQIRLSQRFLFALTPFKFMKHPQTISPAWLGSAATAFCTGGQLCVGLHNQTPHSTGRCQSLGCPTHLATHSVFPPRLGNLLTLTKRWGLSWGHKVVQAQLFLSYGVHLSSSVGPDQGWAVSGLDVPPSALSKARQCWRCWDST